MYEEYFHLESPAFNLGPDPRCLYMTDSIREVLAVLAYGVNTRKGFIQLTGDVGTGKTMILNIFMQWLQSRGAATAFIFNPHLQPDDFINVMLADFGLNRGKDSKGECMLRFNQWLLDCYHAERPVVLCVDEAQQLSVDVLEELRLLTNLETPSHKLLQIALCGQSELIELLARPSMRQLRQRITLRCSTTPFNVTQTTEYIIQRLKIAGAKDTNLFEENAVDEIHRVSGGIPRVINLLCESLLIEGFCDRRKKISLNMVWKVARDMELGTSSELAEDRSDEGSAVDEESSIVVTGAAKRMVERFS